MTNLPEKRAKSYKVMNSQPVTAFYKWGTIKKEKNVARIHKLPSIKSKW